MPYKSPYSKEQQFEFMAKAIELSKHSIDNKLGGPFGCVIVKDGEIIADGHNQVTSTNDPTAHAEVVAIRKAANYLRDFKLSGCEIYTSCEPCPMCLSAIYWARVDAVYYANTKSDAKEIGFDDSFIYDEIMTEIENRNLPMYKLEVPLAINVFKEWDTLKDKIEY